MSDIVISVENLSKSYLIGHRSAEREHCNLLRDIISREARNFARKTSDLLHGRQIVQGDRIEELWALKDVSFEVRQGEVLGVIGNNGAGKSTLLKILSRITPPTKGRIRLRGRVGSLLEVGTGFHPELTGRENIFLNGAILGMSRREISQKFDEIAAFAEVERFLDTPVKRYSSGMYVRLAFAVAAHLEPDILIVDEVLAVGDVAFQKKCLGKMGDIATKNGRTVLFVSHNMAALEGLCGAALLLADGAVAARGTVKRVIADYLATIPALSPRVARRHVGDDLRIEGVQLLVNGVPSTSIQAGQSCIFRVSYNMLTERPLKSFSCAIMLFCEGQKLVNLWTELHPNFSCTTRALSKKGFIDCHIPKWAFRNHTIRVDVFSHTGHLAQDWIENVLSFNSHDGDFYGSGVITNPDEGIMFLEHQWSSINHAMDFEQSNIMCGQEQFGAL
jgi:lipopolysaccharide transport system ATP-binding protein